MHDSDHLLENAIDQVIFLLLSGSAIGLFYLWFISNIVQTNNSFFWHLAFPISCIFALYFRRYYSFYHKKLSIRSVVPYVIFFVFLTISIVYFLEPVIQYPFSALGIPNKDLHDGITQFIFTNGFPPSEFDYGASAQYIPNSKDGLFLGYPNAMHVMAAYFMKMGFANVFNATWFTMIFGLILSSLSIFLLIKTVWKDAYIAALFGGFFMLSSFRIPYAAVTSIPMLFSYSLVLPVLFFCFVSVKQGRHFIAHLIPSISIGLLAATYSGTWTVVIVLLFIYGCIVFITRNNKELYRVMMLFLVIIPILILVFLFQQKIYWQNTFATAVDFDPYELSQLIFPIDRDIYMLLYIAAFLTYVRILCNKHVKLQQNVLLILFFIFNILVLFALPFDTLFHMIQRVFNEYSLIDVNPEGLFGGLNHQRVSRLALLQPFFFIFMFPVYAYFFKNKILKYVLGLCLLFFIGISRYDIGLYNPFHFKIDTLYDSRYEFIPYALISHNRLILPFGLWSQDIVDALDYLKKNTTINDTVMLSDNRQWSEESISGWGSVYIKNKIIRAVDLSKEINTLSIHIPKGMNTYLLMVEGKTRIPDTFSKKVFENDQTIIYFIP
ncbi:MAG: hypothetical protein WC489_06515 [Patescibacteria group bacterium]